ncbi:hypothetical protein QWJ34_07600 [Saccharibacillus sp. CPCC 101409]|uniref:hypothetical protein n=1 Tax=Saccharibacillus sp. CPCC 101409 TaxID=3058041 RepID=UPI0026730FBC|nr:hypothetical protein [Saccharibacillus sp. CPCC 101409]MDO3409624.1 hypothetical protein [Saccharibacillus sp. CPCC 101409]
MYKPKPYNERSDGGKKTIEVSQSEIAAFIRTMRYLKFSCGEPECLPYAGSDALNRLLDAMIDAADESAREREVFAQPNPTAEIFVRGRIARTEDEENGELEPELLELGAAACLYPHPTAELEHPGEEWNFLLPAEKIYSGEALVQHLTRVMYEEGSPERIEKDWRRIPLQIRNLLAAIDFDTELQMNGLLGALRSRSGRGPGLLAGMFAALGLDEDSRLIAELSKRRDTEEKGDRIDYSESFWNALSEAERRLSALHDPDLFYRKMFEYAEPNRLSCSKQTNGGS